MMVTSGETSSLPNLTALVSRDVAAKLVAKAGSLVQLTSLSDAALRHLGFDVEAAQFRRAGHLQSGYLLEAPIFVEFFGNDEVRGDDMRAARKALDVLARKCTIAAKADLAGCAPTGELGASELQQLRRRYETLLTEGKVNATDTQALPVPRVFVRGDDAAKKKRGGRKEFRKQQAQRDTPSVLERAVSHVKMGVSEEEQLQALMQRSDVRAELMKGVAKAPESRKRQRDGDEEEYDDLMNIRL